ncbi:MAG: hypothetical protein KAJ39_06415 [Gammaproteobacteria bacterium]|nr:hypothetical protein [Gammaproteobacteria bacterium]
MAKKNEYKPKCIPIDVSTWEVLRNHYGAENIVGYLILKVNINRVTYAVHKVHGTDTLDEDDNRINLCIGSQIADTITMKCDVSDISFFVDNHGSFLFMISHSKGVIHGGSTRFESLDWANEHNHLQGYLDKITEER